MMYEALTHALFALAGDFGTALPLYHGSGPDWFPVETIPDGDIWYAHHFWHGVFLAALVVWYRGVKPDPDTPRYARKPVFTVAGLMLAVYGWLFMWHGGRAPFWGATFSLVGTTVAVVSVAVSPYWRRHSLGNYREKIAARWSDATACVRSGWRDALWCATRTVGYPVVYPEVIARWVARRVVSTRTATAVALLIAYDDAVDHALPVTTPLDALWRNSGHEVSKDAAGWTVTLLEWVIRAVNGFVNLFTDLLTLAL